MNDGPKSVSIDEAARLMGCSRRTIYNHIKTGRLATIRVGTSQRVLRESITVLWESLMRTNRRG